MREPERQRMLRDLLVALALLPDLVAEVLAPLTEDEQLAVLEALEIDATACFAMLDDPEGPTPFQPVANLVRRLDDLAEPAPRTSARLKDYERIFRLLRDCDAHHLLFPDDVQH